MILEEPTITVEQFEPVHIMRNLEKACRTCYRSEDKITEDSYKSLLQNCINRGHESVLEHEKITVRLRCDIGVYKDLTRHRLASYSIESTRYCNYNTDKFDGELHLIKPVYYNSDLSTAAGSDENYKNIKLTELWRKSMQDIEETYNAMIEIGGIPDEARMILPHSTAATVTMTANMREWKHILELRCSSHAHPSVRQIMIPLLLKFQETMPYIFKKIDYDRSFPKEKYAKLIVEGE